MVTAFRALNDIVPSTRQESGLVADWQQARGHLLIGGNVKNLRIWDAGKDCCMQVGAAPFLRYRVAKSVEKEFPSRSNSCMTSLTSDQTSGNILVGGFGDGIVRVYDRRLPPRDTMVKAWRGAHAAWIQNVHMQKGGQRELVSGR